jgi:hypothetical protein
MKHTNAPLLSVSLLIPIAVCMTLWVTSVKAQVKQTEAQAEDPQKGNITQQRMPDAQAAKPESAINPSCREQTAINAVLEQIKGFYESGDALALQSKLDPAMVGYLGYVEAFKRETVQFTQRQLSYALPVYQCGPDVAIVSFSWEKRFFDVVSFKPALTTGSSSILLQRDNTSGWRMIASAGDNLFSSASGSRAQLNVNGSVNVGLLFQSAPALLNRGVNALVAQKGLAPINIEVIDADQIGKGSVNVLLSTDYGDVERVSLPEVSPGKFVLTGVQLALAMPMQYNNSLEVLNASRIEILYVDEKSGGLAGAQVLRARLPITNNTLSLGPNAFTFNQVPAQPADTVVTSNAFVVNGLTASSSATATAPGQLIVDGAPAVSGSPIRNGQTVAVRLTALPAVGSVASSTVSINGLTATFSVTTAPITGPNAFSFNQIPSQLPGTTVTSNVITVSGLSAASTVTATAPGQLIVDGAPAVSGSAIRNGQTVGVRLTALTPAGSNVSSTVSINGMTSTFFVSTLAVTTPTAFAIPTAIQIGAAVAGNPTRFCVGGTFTSTPVTITGINTNVSVLITPSFGYTVSAIGGATISPNGTLILTATADPTITGAIAAPSALLPVATITVGTGAPVSWTRRCN